MNAYRCHGLFRSASLSKSGHRVVPKLSRLVKQAVATATVAAIASDVAPAALGLPSKKFRG